MSVKALRCSYFLLLTVLAFSSLSLGQSPQSRYLAYSTYSPQPGVSLYSAVNSAGVLCVANSSFSTPTEFQYPSGLVEIYQLRADGSLVFDKSITIFTNIANAVSLSAISGVDNAGNCYLATSSVPQGPVPMTLQKYDSTGNLVFSVNYAGSGTQVPSGMAIDTSGNIWLSGSTQSNDLQLVNPIQSTLKGSQNAFIAEFNSSGTLIFSTYFGGTGRDSAGGLALDGSGNAYIAGTTSSTDFPTLNPLEPSLTSNSSAFLSKIDSAGHLAYSTYLGTTVGSDASGVAVDGSGNIFVSGPSLAKLNAAGSAVVYSVATGSGGPTAVDNQGNAYTAVCPAVGGPPPSCPFSLLNPIQSEASEGLAGFDPNGALIFYTRFGAELGPGIGPAVFSLGVDSAGNLYASVSDEFEIGNAVPVPLRNAVNGTVPCTVVTNSTLLPTCEGVVAKIALGASASFSMPTTVDFSSLDVPVGSTGVVGVNIYNTGITDITISGMTISGDYSQTNNTCPGSLASATTCSFSISFTPTATGTRTGVLTITDNSPGSPHIIKLTGVVAVPAASLSPSSLTFSSQAIGSTSSAQTVTLTNSGDATMSLSRIATSGDFAETNSCGASLPNGANCTISVTFTPTASGTRTGTLTIADNAAGSPQTVSLSGTGGTTGLGLGAAPGSSTSSTVSAGQTASYKLTIGGQGMSGTASLKCTGAPTGATCSVPSTVNVSGTTAATFNVSVATTPRSSGLLIPPGTNPNWMWATSLLGLLFIPAGSSRKRSRPRGVWRMLPFLLLLLLCACGGSSTTPTQTGTPAGSYSLTVTANVGSTTQSTVLKLTVQ